MQRLALAGGDEGQVDLGVLRGGQLLLRLLSGFLQALAGHLVGRQVHTLGVFEGLHHPVDDGLVPVVTAELGVTAGGLDVEDAVGDLQDRHVEGAAAEVVDQDGLLLLLVEAIGQCGRGRLVDDAQDAEARDLPGLLGGLALGVAEVRGDGDDGVGDVLAQVRLGVALQLHEDPRGDLLGRERLAVHVGLPVGAHVALDADDGAVGVGDGLALGHLAHQRLTGL